MQSALWTIILTVIITLVVVAITVGLFSKFKVGVSSSGVPLRKNVLILVGMGYAATVGFFIFMCWKGGMTPEEAYKVVQAPLMTLIGGSLAISKDLIPLGDSETSRKPESSNAIDQHSDTTDNDGKNENRSQKEVEEKVS